MLFSQPLDRRRLLAFDVRLLAIGKLVATEVRGATSSSGTRKCLA